MEWNEEYKRKYRETIRNRLPRSFVAMYEKKGWLHDFYLKSFYIANTGPNLHAYSARGSTTVQMEFYNASNDNNILLIYKNATEIRIEHKGSSDVSFLAPTGFGQCITNVFDIGEDSQITHEYEFEGDSVISITCESIRYQKVINAYW